MIRIQQITNDTLQKQTLILADGSFVQITLYFMPLQAGWFIREIVYNDFVLNNIRITVGPDMLYQFKNQIPFGLCCTCTEKREPMFQDDFSSGICKLFVIDADEIAIMEEILANG